MAVLDRFHWTPLMSNILNKAMKLTVRTNMENKIHSSIIVFTIARVYKVKAMKRMASKCLKECTIWWGKKKDGSIPFLQYWRQWKVERRTHSRIAISRTGVGKWGRRIRRRRYSKEQENYIVGRMGGRVQDKPRVGWPSCPQQEAHCVLQHVGHWLGQWEEVRLGGWEMWQTSTAACSSNYTPMYCTP